MPADPGYFVQGIGSISERPCPAGTSTLVPASTSCANTPPVVNAGQGYSGTEGSAIALSGPSEPSATDPDGDPISAYSWIVTGGPAAGTCSFSDSTSLNPTVTCTEDGSYTIQLTATDQDSLSSSATTQVTVTDAIPQVAVTAPRFGQLYPIDSSGTAAVSLKASFMDAGTADTHTCSVQWDTSLATVPGTVTEPTSTAGSCAASNNLTPGVYLVTVKVLESDNANGAVGTATTEVVVYDPNAGFVTGGGWINSPARALTANLALTGTANFGFVSKYQKGSSVPTGQTEFQFQVGNLDFHSNTYTVLTISGNQAQYRGSGTINGQNDSAGNPYKFILTARDGDMSGWNETITPDGLRMKITDSNGNVIYDNLQGATDALGNTQPIAGGDIVIHSK
jgi:hypothetical protein